MRIRSAAVHAAQALAEGAILALLVVTLVAGTALAAKGQGGGGKPGGGAGTATLELVMVTDNDRSNTPNWGDQVTFRVSTTVTARPYVQVDCYQGSTYVFSQWAGFYPDFAWPWLETFTLSNSMWTSGAASCTATVYYQTSKGSKTILTQPFQVGA